MLNKMAMKLSDRLLRNGVITEDILDIYVYGFELIISSLTNIITVLLVGILINRFFQTLAFLFVFILLRSFSGGYHANTYVKCSIVTFSTYALVLLVSNFLIVPKMVYLALLLIGFVILCIFAPIKNPNKELTVMKARIFKVLSASIFTLLVTAGMFLKESLTSISNVIFFTLVSVLLLLFVKNKRERRKSNESI